jgi:hypothetical protein
MRKKEKREPVGSQILNPFMAHDLGPTKNKKTKEASYSKGREKRKIPAWLPSEKHKLQHRTMYEESKTKKRADHGTAIKQIMVMTVMLMI